MLQFDIKDNLVLSPTDIECFSDLKVVAGMLTARNYIAYHLTKAPNIFIVKEDKTVDRVNVIDSCTDILSRFNKVIYAHSMTKSSVSYAIYSENFKLKDYCFCHVYTNSYQIKQTSACYAFVHRKVLGELFGLDGLYEL